MTSLASTLAGVLLSWLIGTVLGAIATWLVRWCQCGWLPSELPRLLGDDPAWDERMLGWWCDEVVVDGQFWAETGITYRRTSDNSLQFLLTAEQVYGVVS